MSRRLLARLQRLEHRYEEAQRLGAEILTALRDLSPDELARFARDNAHLLNPTEGHRP